MLTVDTRGQQCPSPIIATKKALKEANPGDKFMVITDNQTSLNNLKRFLSDNKTKFSVFEEEGIWTLTITKEISGAVQKPEKDYCSTEIPHLNYGSFVIAFSSDRMGEGDSELGHLLLTNFIKAIKDLEELPGKMVFYNSGVRLGTFDSPVHDHIREIEKMGVKLFFCATCAKYYSLEEKIRIGTPSNMFEIAQIMASASSVIKP